MTHLDSQIPLLPPALVAEIEAAAAAEQRPAHEMVREAFELYLQDRRLNTATATPGASRTALQAAARILERRKRHPLPAGASIREMMTHGRA